MGLICKLHLTLRHMLGHTTKHPAMVQLYIWTVNNSKYGSNLWWINNWNSYWLWYMVNVSLGHDVDYKLDGFVMIREDPKFKILQRKYWVSMFQNLYSSHLDQSCLATCATLTLGRTPLRRILPFLKDLLQLFHFISIESQHKCIGLVFNL